MPLNENDMSKRIRGVDVKFNSSGNPSFRDASQGQAPGTGRPVYEDPNKRGRFHFYPEPIEKAIDPVGTMVRKVTPPPPGVPQVESISQSTRLDIILETVNMILEDAERAKERKRLRTNAEERARATVRERVANTRSREGYNQSDKDAVKMNTKGTSLRNDLADRLKQMRSSGLGTVAQGILSRLSTIGGGGARFQISQMDSILSKLK